ncbi:uncharacterized protein LOC111334188 isoform X1 [Stylophora pistillata]|uniref:uncharacterized protein LOC111334188 isoform X1 n=1 Tax=Stylophora pistillata TaxID=50429 RepID=UPI000C053E42|nr:uncharacterized protein LOC111334188 isoform X1 [Stylophora pistillata]
MVCERPAKDAKIILLLKLVVLLRAGAQEYKQTPKECRGVLPLTDKNGSFTSPGGYKGYPNNTVCSWSITAAYDAEIRITFHDFDLEWSKTCIPYDYVTVSEKCLSSNAWSSNLGSGDNVDGFCGNMTTFSVESRCEKVLIEFKSDDSITGKGFNATYEVIPDPKKPKIISLCQDGTSNCSPTIVFTEYEEGNIPCQVAGSVDLQTWSYLGSDNENLNGSFDGLRMFITDEGGLFIRELKRSDTGFYKCFVENSLGNDSAVMYLRVKEKCNCPKNIFANWYNIPPYVKYNGPGQNPTGLFPQFLPQLFSHCCGNCSEGNGPSEIIYDAKFQETLMDIKDVINLGSNDTITFPISGKKDDDLYKNEFYFLPLISSPGVAFIVVEDEPGTSAKAVFDSVVSGWPVLVLTVLMALLSGIVMWGLDTWYNPEEFPRSFIKGSGEGFWWAFVTMTTVGYGDRSPRGFLARIFAIVWVLVGLVITSIFTGVVTTSLTAITLSTDVKLYGTKIAAVANSTEYKLGMSKNAVLKEFNDLQSIVEPLKNREDNLKGVLVDTYVAGEMREFVSDELRVNKIIDDDSYYGIVFGEGQLTNISIQNCFSSYVLSHKAEIFEIVKQGTQPMSEPDGNEALERSSGLFDATSPLFQRSMYTCIGLLLLFATCGIIWDYGYMRYWKKKAEKEELELLGIPAYEMAKKNLDMLDAMMEEVQDFYDNWEKRMDEIVDKHEMQLRLQAKMKNLDGNATGKSSYENELYMNR